MFQQFSLNQYTPSIIAKRDEVPYQRAGSNNQNEDSLIKFPSNTVVADSATIHINSDSLMMTQQSNEKCSFPRKTLFYKIVGPLTMILMVTSILILVAKRCTQAITSEWEARQLLTNPINIDNPFEYDQQQQRLKQFFAGFFLKLHILHGLAFFGSIMIILYSYVDLVPKRKVDFKYAFHILSIFILFCISISTLYASFVAYQRPCLAPEGIDCCKVIGTPGLLGPNENKSPITSISSKETSMIMVMIFDLLVGVMFFTTTVVYFRHVRHDAAQCGYLYRVHNQSYIIR